MIDEEHNPFDPFSPESLNTVEQIEAIPHSKAFEHAIYDNKLTRTARYEYDHYQGEDADRQPILIDPNLMITQFPEPLRDVFPKIAYSIERLQIEQIEKEDETTLRLQFSADQTNHTATIENGIVRYVTTNEALDEVVYEFEPETIIGLMATFVYARQYDSTSSSARIELTESSLYTPRGAHVELTERMVMTLGDHSGHASTETLAIFENASGSPIVAVLKDREYPDKSAVATTLQLDRLDEFNDHLTSTETKLYQNTVNVERGTIFMDPGELTERHVEQRSTTLSSTPLLASETFYPDHDHARWVQTCRSFLEVIEQPMATYAELDSPFLD